jgi:hypothetical protein
MAASLTGVSDDINASANIGLRLNGGSDLIVAVGGR